MKRINKRYIVINLTNFEIMLASNKLEISNKTGIHKNTLINLQERNYISHYLIIYVTGVNVWY